MSEIDMQLWKEIKLRYFEDTLAAIINGLKKLHTGQICGTVDPCDMQIIEEAAIELHMELCRVVGAAGCQNTIDTTLLGLADQIAVSSHACHQELASRVELRNSVDNAPLLGIISKSSELRGLIDAAESVT